MKSAIVLLALLSIGLAADPSNYEYYTSGGIKSGLKADSDHFTLNGKQIRLFSGSLHYFRLPKQYWRDRLIKFKAAGLNTVQTYIAWNLHEEKPGHFDFETGFLNLVDFLKACKDADLFVYLRIGPYICAEWELGGYPAWLLKDPNMRFRSNYKPHLDAVGKYFNKVLSIINDFQFKKSGPIIALQFENEYGGIRNNNDLEYFQFMKDVIDKSGFNELLANCDPGTNAARAAPHVLPGVLETENGNSNMVADLMALKKVQPNKPLHVTEFWPGWYDDWGDQGHHKMSLQRFESEVTDILFKANSSINFYMFFGGTNFGFTAGGDGEGKAMTTSYDYNAPLSESGNYTDKYYKTRELIIKLTKEKNLPKVHIPDPPKVDPTVAYGDIKVKDYLTLEDLLSQIQPNITTEAKHMEYFDQTFGFISYRISHKKFKQLRLTKGASDIAIVVIDNKQKAVAYGPHDFNVTANDSDFDNKTLSDHRVDILVENIGRAKIGDLNHQRRGLDGDVLIDNQKVNRYEVFSLDFKESYVQRLKTMKGKPYQHHKQITPTLYRAELTIEDKPRDTFLRFDNWKRGVVFVNNFNIGRYYDIGPQKTLYLPAPLLKTGTNDIFIFESFSSADKIESVSQPDLGK